MKEVLEKVFRTKKYLLLALSGSFTAYVLAVWFPNFRLIAVVFSSDASLVEKLAVPVSLLGSISTNFTLLSAFSTVSIAVLFGINIALLAYFLNNRIADVRQSGAATGFLGLVSAVAGTGCAACGSFLLVSGFSLIGATSLLSFLPLGGGEFGLLAIGLLSLSIYLTAKQITKPAVCAVD